MRRCTQLLALALQTIFAWEDGSYDAGHYSCPCLFTSEDHGIEAAGSPAIAQWTSTYMYGAYDYGIRYGLGCFSHDNEKPPSCNVANADKPSWCLDP